MVLRKDSTFTGIWHEFTQSTNMHGLGCIGRDHSSVIRVMIWTVLVVLGTVTLGFYVYNLILMYLAYGVTTDVTIKFRTSQVFPAVTFCNLNPVRRHILDQLYKHNAATYKLWAIKEDIRVNYSQNPFDIGFEVGYTGATPGQVYQVTYAPDDAARKKREVSLRTGVPATPTSPTVSKNSVTTHTYPPVSSVVQTTTTGSVQTSTTEIWPSFSPDLSWTTRYYETPPPPEQYVVTNGSEWASDKSEKEFWDQIEEWGYVDSYWEVEYLKKEFLETLAGTDRSYSKFLGHQKETMIIDCTFDGKICTPSQFNWFWNYKYGNCYTFNSAWNDSQTANLRGAERPGPLHGLQLELFIEESQYTEEVAGNTGVKVVIHAPNRMPFPEDEGLQLPPGFMSSIGVRMVNITRMPYPYSSDCENGSRVRNGYDTVHRKVAYTTQVCTKTCMQVATIMKCGCASNEFPFDTPVFRKVKLDNGSYWKDTAMTVCSSNNDTQFICMEDVKEKIKCGNVSTMCDQCRPACNDVIFSTRNSFSQWPSKQYSETMAAKLRQRSPFWDLQLDLLEDRESMKHRPLRRMGTQNNITETPFRWKSLLPLLLTGPKKSS